MLIAHLGWRAWVARSQPRVVTLCIWRQAEVRAREARTVFNSYDRNRSGALEVEELQTCLEDLGIMVRQTK
jgi:EF-hand domain